MADANLCEGDLTRKAERFSGMWCQGLLFEVGGGEIASGATNMCAGPMSVRAATARSQNKNPLTPSPDPPHPSPQTT